MFGLNHITPYFRHAPIRTKLTLAISLTAFVVLLLTISTFAIYEHSNQKQQTEQNLSTLANLTSWNAQASLLTTDTDSANLSLEALKAQPEIVGAFLYNHNGYLLAKYNTSKQTFNESDGMLAAKIISDSSILSSASINLSAFEQLNQWFKNLFSRTSRHPLLSGYSEVTYYDQNGHLHLFRPIFKQNNLIGILHLANDRSNRNIFLSHFYLIASILTLFTLLIARYVSNRLQPFFLTPVQRLLHAMQSIVHSNKFTAHITKNQNDEFGQLIDIYNEMLDEIHHRSQLLAWHRNKLTSQVQNNITELSNHNSELQETIQNVVIAKQEAETTSQAKSEFLAKMSHEIRTLLNAILGMVDYLWLSDLQNEQHRSVDVIKQSSSVLLRILNDIIDFSNIESGSFVLSPQLFNCRTLIYDSFESLKPEAIAKSLRYQLHIKSDLPELVVGDSIRLQQVLLNLLSNAVKFTAQGEVTLSVSAQPVSDQIVRLYYEITDTGIGIQAEKLKMIFEAFSQSDSAMAKIYQGTGLGLAISKQLIQLMNGQIGVSSQPGIGSTFWFWIPLEKSKAPSKPLKTPTNFRFKANLLVAEDYPANQLVVRRFLEDLGCQVELVNNGFEAVKALKKRHFDLVFMDCQMPFMDGYQATQEIRRTELAIGSGKHTPVIALTAHALSEDEAKCSDAGMDEWVTKPFTRQDLSKTLQKWLPKELILTDQPPLRTDIKTLAKASNVIEYTTAIDMAFFTRQFNLENLDDLAFITSLTQAFQQSAAQVLSNLQHSIDIEDAEQIRKLAHGMKSLSTNVGSGKLTELCSMMEFAGKTNELNDVQYLLDNMKQEYLRVLTELNSLSTTV